MINVDLSMWTRLEPLQPPRFRLKKYDVRKIFPAFNWVVEDGYCDDLVPGRLPLMNSAAAQLITVYNLPNLNERIYRNGWLGLAEGFMAGEWDAHDPAYLWEHFLSQKKQYGHKERVQRRQPLVANPRCRNFDFFACYLDETFNLGAADFINGPRTQIEEKGVKEVYLEDPMPLPLRKDLYGAQRRRVSRTLMDADVRRRDRILFVGAEWGETAIEAAQFGCDVTVLCESEEIEKALTKRVEATQSGKLRLIPGLFVGTGTYDVIISVSAMPNDRLFDAVMQLARTDLSSRGRVVIERPWRGNSAAEFPLAWWWAYVGTDTLLRSRNECVAGMKAIGLNLVQANHCDQHYLRSLELWDEGFRANVVKLGALGYDAVYRRLWRTALAIARACIRNGSVSYQRLIFQRQ